MFFLGMDIKRFFRKILVALKTKDTNLPVLNSLSDVPESKSEETLIDKYWREKKKKEEKRQICLSTYIQAKIEMNQHIEVIHNIKAFLAEETPFMTGDITGAQLNGHPTYEYANNRGKDDLPTMLACCQAELKNFVCNAILPAPFYFYRVAILARKLKRYQLEIDICEMLIFAFDTYVEGQYQCRIDPYPYVKGSPRYRDAIRRLPRAKELLAKQLAKQQQSV